MKPFARFNFFHYQPHLIFRIIVILLCVLTVIPILPNCQGKNPDLTLEAPSDFTQFSLEELKKVEIIKTTGIEELKILVICDWSFVIGHLLFANDQ